MAEDVKRGLLSTENLEKLAFFRKQLEEAERNIAEIQGRCDHKMSGIRGMGIQVLSCKHCRWSEGPTYD
jgi:hypothetical protein